MTDNLKKLLAAIEHEHVYIQTHNFPDPDAIASAYGLQQLLRHFNISATICYKGKIERYNTNYIMHQLGITLQNVVDIDSLLQVDDEVLLVDVQKFNANVVDIRGEEIVSIDHHPTFIPATYRFSDIRPDVGSCAAIIASYFFENDIPMDSKTALILTFGIRSDTAKLSRGVSQLDLDMLCKMFPYCDKDVIYYLENSVLEQDDLMAYAKAIESIQQPEKGIAFAYAGEECHEALIALVADFILSMADVEFAVVYSHKQEGLKYSVRCSSGLDAGQITAKALLGLGSGGGHPVMAGGFVPFTGTEQQQKELVDAIEENFLKEIAEAEAAEKEKAEKQN